MGELLIAAIAIITPFVFVVLVLGIICFTIVKSTKGGQKARQMRTDEARVVQEIFDGLTRMEQRVETLETLLVEKERASK